MNNWAAIHSSERHDWRTPQPLFHSLDTLFRFELDAAADSENKLCQKFFSLESDALNQSWQVDGWVWVNPPYGKQVAHWFEKAINESERGAKIVMMCMACTETKWFQRAWEHCAEIWFLNPRNMIITWNITNNAVQTNPWRNNSFYHHNKFNQIFL